MIEMVDILDFDKNNEEECEEYEYVDEDSCILPSFDFSLKKIIHYLIVLIILFLWVSMTIVAGYYAWNEFPNDIWGKKFIKTYLAVMFAPLYLFYIFCKISIFG